MGEHIRSPAPGPWTLVEEMPDFGAIFTDDAVNRIAKAGGVQISRDELIKVARNYWPIRHARNRPLAAADRDTLVRIAALAEKLGSEINSLPETALSRLWRVSGRTNEVLANLQRDLHALAGWTKAAAAAVASTTGRPADTHINVTIDALAGVYQTYKGSRPGRSATGPFAKLVMAFFEVVDPGQCVSGDTVRKYLKRGR